MTGRGAGGQEQGARTFVLQEDGSRLGLSLRSFSAGTAVQLYSCTVCLYSSSYAAVVLTDSGCGVALDIVECRLNCAAVLTLDTCTHRT